MRSVGRRGTTILALSLLMPLPAVPAAADPPPGAIAALNLSPTSRTVRPVAVFRATSVVSNPTQVLTGGATRLNGTAAVLTLDFGEETAGIPTLRTGAT